MMRALAVLLTAVLAGWASDATCILVDSPNITVATLAPRIRGLAKLPAEIVIAPAPNFGARRDFTPAWLERWAQQQAHTISVSDPICVMRRSADKAAIAWEKELREALASLYSFEPAQDELKLLDTALNAGAPGDVVLERHGLTYDRMRDEYLWRGRLAAPTSSSPLAIRFRVTKRVEHWVTAKSLPTGKKITADDLVRLSQPFRPDQPTPVSIAEIPEHQVLRRSLPKGTILLAQHLAPAPLIFPGDEVELQSKAGQTVIRLQGIARGKARAGESVLVSAKDTNRLLRAIAVAPGIVEIEANPSRKSQ